MHPDPCFTTHPPSNNHGFLTGCCKRIFLLGSPVHFHDCREGTSIGGRVPLATLPSQPLLPAGAACAAAAARLPGPGPLCESQEEADAVLSGFFCGRNKKRTWWSMPCFCWGDAGVRWFVVEICVCSRSSFHFPSF